MAGKATVSVLLHLKPSSVGQIGEGDLRGHAGVQVVKGVQLLHGGRGHAVAVAEDAGGRSDVRRVAGRHRRPGAAHVAAGIAAVLPHQIPSPFRTRVLKPHLNAKPKDHVSLIDYSTAVSSTPQ